MRLFILSIIAITTAMILQSSAPLLAQDQGPQNPGLPQADLPLANPLFNLNPPGARSLGMGAAFIGTSDDTTAAESNPAGLTKLTRPEISVNIRSTSSSNEAVNPFTRAFPETFTQNESFDDSTSSPSFLSYTHPFASTRFTASIYTSETMNSRSHTNFSLGDRERITRGFTGEAKSETTIKQDNIGLAAAIRINSHISIGASLRSSTARIDLRQSLTLLSSSRDLTEAPIDILGTITETIDDSDQKATWNIGALLDLSEQVAIGLVYKRGAAFEVKSNQQTLIQVLNPSGILDNFMNPGSVAVEFTVPDTYGIGFAYRPNSNWIIGLDWLRVLYSDTVNREQANAFDFSDETEIHFGMEYGFTMGKENTPVFVRAGYYNNPDHDGTDLIDSDQNFVTVGAGVFLKNKLQLDAAVALSEDVTETLLSMVWRL